EARVLAQGGSHSLPGSPSPTESSPRAHQGAVVLRPVPPPPFGGGYRLNGNFSLPSRLWHSTQLLFGDLRVAVFLPDAGATVALSESRHFLLPVVPWFSAGIL